MISKKRYGQNFLIDLNITRKIINALEVSHEDFILEIGPGLGALTSYLINAKKICAIEIDKDLINILHDKFISCNNLDIIHADILKFNLEKVLYNKTKIISNLPYYISTAILTKFFELQDKNKIDFMIFMMQREVAQRIIAKPSEKSYGSLSLCAQFYFDIIKLFDVSPNCFLPKPKIFSTVLKFVPREINLVCDKKILFKIIKLAFATRRKILINCLEELILKSELENIFKLLNLNQKVRGENLSLNDFINLAELIEKNKKIII